MNALTLAISTRASASIHLALLVHEPGLIDQPDGTGATPLTRAARTRDARGVALLCRHGARVDRPDVQGRTALMAAADSGNQKALHHLLVMGGADPGFRSGNKSALTTALRSLNKPAVERLLRASPQYQGAFKRDFRQVLLEDIVACDLPHTLFLLRNYQEHLSEHIITEALFLELRLHEQPIMIRNLLHHGAWLDVSDRRGNTPLRLATLKNTPEIFEILMDRYLELRPQCLTDEEECHEHLLNTCTVRSEKYARLMGLIQ